MLPCDAPSAHRERTGREPDTAFKTMGGFQHPTPGQLRAFHGQDPALVQQAAIPARNSVDERRARPAPDRDEQEIEANATEPQAGLIAGSVPCAHTDGSFRSLAGSPTRSVAIASL